MSNTWRWFCLWLCVLLSACASEGKDTPSNTSDVSAQSIDTADAGAADPDGEQSPETRTPQTNDSGDNQAPCEYVNDGTCDEPANCALGTDNADCANACANKELYWRYGAACAYRSPPPVPNTLPGAQTQGTLNQTGTFDRTIDVALGEGQGNRPRHYRLFVPPHYNPAKAWPLVIMMPGHRVDIYSLAGYTHLESTAEANNFILAYAEQEWRTKSFRWAWWTDWNWKTNPNTNPDIPFLSGLIEDVASHWSINKQRIYGVGHSRGGAMSYIAAFEMADTFAAVCSQSGFTEFGYDKHVVNWTGRKTPVMLVHGIKDTDVSVSASDAMNKQLQGLGWTNDILVYHRLENVAHRWQPWLNQAMWDFLSAHELPTEVVP